MIGTHITVYFGLREAMIALFKDGYDLNVKNTYN